MKPWIVISLILIAQIALGQSKHKDFSSIDSKNQFDNALSPDDLAKQLTAPYITDLEKVSSIFRWITENISYRTYSRNNISARYYQSVWDDTLSEWSSADEMVAKKTLRNRVAFCDGYAKLFKTLCTYAGIRSEVVIGYGRTYNSKKFISNHSWNAVLIDSTWHLLDVTWASGFINSRTDEFIHSYDNFYFLTPPQHFIKDHYPEDARWTLLDDAPALQEFKRSPFKHSNFLKYSIASYYPSKGVIEASVGDTLEFSLTTSNLERDERIASNPFFDSATVVAAPSSVFLSKEMETGKTDKGKAVYSYIVTSTNVQWVYIMYNEDIVLRYRLMVKDRLAKK